MVDPTILGSEWVEPKGGKEWGFKLKPGAPEDVKRQFEEFEAAHKAIDSMARGNGYQKDDEMFILDLGHEEMLESIQKGIEVPKK